MEFWHVCILLYFGQYSSKQLRLQINFIKGWHGESAVVTPLQLTPGDRANGMRRLYLAVKSWDGITISFIVPNCFSFSIY